MKAIAVLIVAHQVQARNFLLISPQPRRVDRTRDRFALGVGGSYGHEVYGWDN